MPPEELEVVPLLTARSSGGRTPQRRRLHWLRLALDAQVLEAFPLERVAGTLPHQLAHVDLAWRRVGHQAGGQVHGVAEAAERAAHRVPVGATQQAAGGDADLDARHAGRLLEGTDPHRCGQRPAGVVLVGLRRSEDGVEVRPLVTDRQLEDVATTVGERSLRPSDEVVELLGAGVVAVVLDAAEAHEDRDRRAQLGEQLAAPRAQALIDGRQDPRSHELLGERRLRIGRHGFGRGDVQPGEDAHGAAAVGIQSSLGDLDPIAERVEPGLADHDLARRGVALGCCQLVDQRSGEHVDQLDRGVAGDEAAGPADDDGHLERQMERSTGRADELARALHRLLHGEGARRPADAVVTVDPAGDGIAAEVDDDAAAGVQLGDQLLEDAVEPGRQLLRSTLRAELGDEHLGDRREPRDVGEQRRALHAMGELAALADGTTPVAGDEGSGEPNVAGDGTDVGGLHPTTRMTSSVGQRSPATGARPPSPYTHIGEARRRGWRSRTRPRLCSRRGGRRRRRSLVAPQPRPVRLLLCLDARTRPRPLRRPDRHQHLPGGWRHLRQGDGRLRRALRAQNARDHADLLDAITTGAVTVAPAG